MKSYDEYKLKVLREKRSGLDSIINLNKRKINRLAKEQAQYKRLRKPLEDDIKQLEQAIKDEE